MAEPKKPKKATAKPAAAWVAKPTYAWRSLVIGGGIPVTGGETAHCSFKPFSRPASLALNRGRISFTTWLPPVRSQPKRPGRMFLSRNQSRSATSFRASLAGPRIRVWRSIACPVLVPLLQGRLIPLASPRSASFK